MPLEIQVLEPKISPPFIKETILQRSHLMKKLNKSLHYPLTLILSGPGYGKSTALATFVHTRKELICWYSVGENDADLIPFLTYLFSCIRKHVPSFGEEIFHYLDSSEDYLREEDIHIFCSLFINEVANISSPIVLILDDIHHVQEAGPIEKWILWLLQHQPSNLVLMLSSRVKPNWLILSYLNLKGQLLEVNQQDLAFSKEEIEVLATDYYQFPISSEQIDMIYDVTEGWTIAVQLMIQQLGKSQFVSEHLIQQKLSLDDLFSFLAMEAFIKQPSFVQQFLMTTCIFEEITPLLCKELLDITNSVDILEDLMSKNLFVVASGKDQYRYHALFKQFLEAQLRQNHVLFTEIHTKSACYFLGREQFLKALHHFRSIQDFEGLADIICRHGATMIQDGYLNQLLELIKEVPEYIKNDNYILWYYEGEIHRYRCMYKDAKSCYEKTEELASKARNLVWEGKAAEGQAKIYIDTIQPSRAESYIQHAISCIEQGENVAAEERGKLYCLMAENLINLGKAAMAAAWYEKVKSVDASVQDNNLEARLNLRTGQLLEAKRLLWKRQKENSHLSSYLQQTHRETTLLLSLIEGAVGNAEEAKELADLGIKLGLSAEAPFVEACGWIRLGHAVQILERYDEELAKECYEVALNIMDELQVPRGKAEPLMGLCILYGKNGLYEKAICHGEQALMETEMVKDDWMSALIQLSMGIAAACNEKEEEASGFLKRAEHLFQNCGDCYGIMLIFLWRTILAFDCKNREELQKNLLLLLEAVKAGGYEFIFKHRTLFGPNDVQKLIPILLEAQSMQKESDYAAMLLHDLGHNETNAHPGYTLRIQTLGGFRVWLGEKEIKERDWQRGKAKELLELLVTKKSVLVPKEEIMLMLWGKADDAATRDFKVALNALNNVLEPHRKARATPFYITRLEGSYTLNSHSGYDLDIIQFEKWFTKGMQEENHFQAAQQLKRALHLYRGDYLPHRLYEDWCIQEREHWRVCFMRAAERLAYLLFEEEQYDQGIYWCERLIEKDGTWEEAYRLMMLCYLKKKNRSQAMKVYVKCREQLKKELGLTPMRETEQIYHMIKYLD